MMSTEPAPGFPLCVWKRGLASYSSCYEVLIPHLVTMYGFFECQRLQLGTLTM
jgi:hypothetical protein